MVTLRYLPLFDPNETLGKNLRWLILSLSIGFAAIHWTYDPGYIMFSRRLTASRYTDFPGRFLGTRMRPHSRHLQRRTLTVGIPSQSLNSKMETHLLELPIPSEDIAFGLMGDFEADTHPNKVSLIAGTYRDENGKPWVLPSVGMVRPLGL